MSFNLEKRKTMLQYGKQTIDQSDIDAIVTVLKENTFLTTGPKVQEFEQKIAQYLGIKYAVAVNSGTAALHCACFAIDLKPDDEIIVPAISFAASSNCVYYCGAKVVFCDLEPNTMNIDISKLENLINKKTKAIIVVDFAGQLCNYSALNKIVKKNNLVLIEDAAHSLGVKGVAKNTDLATLSFHPVKNITTCEGGMIVTNNEDYYIKLKSFRNHGIDIDYKKREQLGSYYYDMTTLGFNYRLPDVLCALGINQLKKIDTFIKKRQAFANYYNKKLEPLKEYLVPLKNKQINAYHIYIIRVNKEKLNRDEVFKELKNMNVGVNVHYKPIYLHSYYQNKLGFKSGLCPIAENLYLNEIITLPLFPTMKIEDIDYVVNVLNNICLKDI